jgi:4-amino-4-deoxy-L-arabinose transferase-like glycosyltransferase
MTERAVPARRDVAEVQVLDAVRHRWPWLALLGVAMLAGILDFWDLGRNGWGNLYYAAAVRSMLESWQAFRYAAFDPAGFVTVDKPPLAFWIQAAAAKLIGFGSMALLGPSALAGAISVGVLGRTVWRLFGVWAGLVAALVLALTPIALVADRSNNTDAIMVMLLVLAAWAGVRALESGSWGWVVLAAVLFGLAFMTKMLAAFLVLPGVAVAYLVFGPRRLRVRLAQLGAAGAVLAAITFGYLLSVDLTPASSRPWVGSTQNNSEISLAFGYNGLARVSGSAGGARVFQNGHAVEVTQDTAGIGSAGAFLGSKAGPTRLLTAVIAAQGSWLLPLALTGLVSALAALAWCRRSRRLGGLTLFTLCSGVAWAEFSFGGALHPYYISELAPAVAALVGIGVVSLWRNLLSPGWRRVLPAAAVASTGVFEWSVMRSTGSLAAWSWALLAVSVVLAVLALVARPLARPGRWQIGSGAGVATAAVSVGLALLLVAPAAWTGNAIATTPNGTIPMASAPGSTTAGTGPSQGDTGPLLSFLERNAGADTYLLGIDSPPDGGVTDALVAQSGKRIVPLSRNVGFGSGRLTERRVAGWVERGEIRYFLVQTNGVQEIAGQAPTPLSAAVARVCAPVPSREWGGSGRLGRIAMGEELYDCAGRGDRLMAASHAASGHRNQRTRSAPSTAA